MAKHSPHIIKGAPYIPFELYEEHLARKDAALRMAQEVVEEWCKTLPDPFFTLPKFARHGTEYRDIRAWVDAALAACRAELENK